ncbi:ABC transporter ATP-binding protein [Holophaga foetida]|uniref:ABC transporter ATP-binding protein n=1 Tax=Holophaga foetida TaxID=35839 RepID=UPI0005B78ADA|nr:ABC transporter ATP-binding protein [Holophaga foetida]
MATLSARNLGFSYHRTPVISKVDIQIEGGVTALLGPNGSGKTTLLKLLLGLLKPAHGQVFLDGVDLQSLGHRQAAKRMAYVPQVHREAFAYQVEDVVLMGRMPHASFLSPYSREDREQAREAMERLGILHLARRPYTQVSGGERQLALIARAMTQGAQVFIMDEPTNGLDYGNQVRLLERLQTLAQGGLSFIFSTHHPDHALSVADRVVMMSQGQILRDGDAGTIDAESLEAIYGVDVRLFHVQSGIRVCVPGLRLRPIAC